MDFILATQNDDDRNSIGVGCAAAIGFFFLLLVGALEGIRWMAVPLSADFVGRWSLRLTHPLFKTDQYNEGHTKTLEGTDRPLRPVRWYARRLNFQKTQL